MQDFITLNPAAVENLLDGHLPPYAAVKPTDTGFLITPFKIRRGDVQPVTEAGFLLPQMSTEADHKTRYAVRLADNGDIVVYRTDQPRKAFQPSATIIAKKITPEAEPVKPVRVRHEPVEIVPEAPRGFLIRKTELDAIPVPPEPPRIIDTPDAMEARILGDWQPKREVRETIHFAQVEEPLPMGARRAVEKVIQVPVSFDRRRGAGTRPVEVMIKRRRMIH